MAAQLQRGATDVEDATWLTALVVRLLPEKPEPRRLLVLMQLYLARTAARFTMAVGLILLSEQEQAVWDRAIIAGTVTLLEQDAALSRPGPYPLEARLRPAMPKRRRGRRPTGGR